MVKVPAGGDWFVRCWSAFCLDPRSTLASRAGQPLRHVPPGGSDEDAVVNTGNCMHCRDPDMAVWIAGHSNLESFARKNVTYIHGVISDCMIELVESMPEPVIVGITGSEHVEEHQISMIELLDHLWKVDEMPARTYNENVRALRRWSAAAAPHAQAALRQVMGLAIAGDSRAPAS